MQHVILYSGGLDSFLTRQYLTSKKIDSILLYFNIGARCTGAEIELFNKDDFKSVINEGVTISDVLSLGSMETESAYIPNRNIIAAIAAQSVFDANNIWIGGTLSDRVNDNNDEVFRDLSNLLSKMHQRKITITSPFYGEHKCDVVRDYVLTNGWGHYTNQQDARKSLIKATFSCYNPLSSEQDVEIKCAEEVLTIKTKECLECNACFRKCMSMFAGGIFIPMKRTDKSVDIVRHYIDEAKNSNDSAMKSRFNMTIRYGDALGTYWKKIYG